MATRACALAGETPLPIQNPILKKGALIYNPVAGRRPARREHEIRSAAAVLRKAGIEIELAPTERPNMAHELAQAAVNRGADVVFACGGDGTINEVINGLAPSHVPLAILPGGTANILAHELRIPLHPVAAARQFSRWSPRRIALGRAHWIESPAASREGAASPQSMSRYYVSVAGVGYDAEVVYKLSPWLKKNFGVTGYVLEALRQFATYSFPKFSCRMDGIEKPSTFSVIHRTRLYAGWLHMAPTADLFKPHLAVCSFPSRNRFRYLVYALAVLLRQHLRLGDVSLDDCSTAICSLVDPSDKIWFELDGELGGLLPAEFEVVPDALTLMVP
jgi:diacylglycerol kinase (ATP)